MDLHDYIKTAVERLKLPYFQCLVKKNGVEIFKYTYVNDDINNNLLNMYSMSKPITACAILQLFEKGKLDLMDNVSKYLPGFNNLCLINGKHVDNCITIHNLLTMTSGLDYDLQKAAILNAVKSNPNATTVDVCSSFAKDGLLFSPGTGFQYSLSYDVLAAIIEVVSKKRFSVYIRDNIFKPLKMSNSTFEYDQLLSSSARKEYVVENNIFKLKKDTYKYFFPSNNYESGGAGLISTVEDYSKFIDSLANNKEAILKNSSVDLLSKIYVYDTPFDESVHQYSKSNVDYGYGYGVRVRKQESVEGLPQGEFGWDGAAGSYSLCDRKNKVSIVMGMTIFDWPFYLKDFHIAIVKEIYKCLISNDK